MNASFSQALAAQGRVIWALSLRELHGMHGESRLGYLWQLIKIGFSIAVFWGIRSLLGVHMPASLPLPVYLLTGFIPWYTFSDLFKHAMEAVRTNHALLNFPQITTLDIMLGSGVLTIATHAVLLLLYLAFFLFLDIPFALYNPGGFLISYLAMAAFGFGLGLILAVLNAYFPTTEKIVPMVMRFLFFTSGVFIPIARFSNLGIMDVLLWNPILNYIELLRSCFLSPAFPLAPEPRLFFSLAALTLVIGLFLERSCRGKLIQGVRA
jgi:capsular polysaccharide transport system permease protein